MEKSAKLSPCGHFRYRLGRRWGEGDVLVFVMLNPSTADHRDDDATIRRCIGFATRSGYAAIDVVNLYAYRTRSPRELQASGYNAGPENDLHILDAVTQGACVCVAWGRNARDPSRRRHVLALLDRAGVNPMALGLTREGLPRHPLMLRNTCELVPYRA